MLSTGVDIIEIHRIARVLERYGDRFLRRIYTPASWNTAAAVRPSWPPASPPRKPR